MMDQITEDLFVDESMIDFLTEHWEDILGNRKSRRKLPKLLSVLADTIVTEEYLDKMKKLRYHTAGLSRLDSSLLDGAIKTGQYNMDWSREMRARVGRNLALSSP